MPDRLPKLLQAAPRLFIASGADAVVAVMCWVLYHVAQFGVVVMPWFVPVMVGLGVWGCVLFSRLRRYFRLRGEAAAANIIPTEWQWLSATLFVCLVVALVAAVYPVILYVPVGLLRSLMVSVFVCGVAGLLSMYRGSSLLVCIVLGVALMWACLQPGLFYSFSVHPYSFCLRLPFWFAVFAFALFFRLRRSLQPPGIAMQVLCSLVAMAALVELLDRASEDGRIAAFCPVYAGAVVCVWLLMILRGRVSEGAWYAIGWPLMALPPLLALGYMGVMQG